MLLLGCKNEALDCRSIMLDNTLLKDETLAKADTTYTKAVEIIKKIIETTRQIVGDNFSYNNLFKNQIIVDMLDKQIENTQTKSV